MVDNGKTTLETSVTLEYVAERWNVSRIVLDGSQNHLPGDTGGSSIELQFLVGGNWLPLSKVSSAEGIKAIAFVDDGRGYDYRKLKLLYSDKPDNGDGKAPVGRFGEGLKLTAPACLRNGISMQIRSRDWQAFPRAVEVPLDGKTAHQLVFDVDTGLPSVVGSSTIFLNPTSEMIEESLSIGKKVLIFREGYKPLYAGEGGNYIADNSGDVFVKGVWITSNYRERLLFGYDLNIDNLPRDRDHVEIDELGNAVGKLLAQCSDERTIRTLMLKMSQENANARSWENELIESRYIAYEWKGGGGRGRDISHPEIWQKVFTDIFGERAVIPSCRENGTDYDRLASLAGYHIAPLNRHFADVLRRCGVKMSRDIAMNVDSFLTADAELGDNVTIDAHETSISLSYRVGKWSNLRIALDAVSNHLDAAGPSIKVEFKVSKGENSGFKWVPKEALNHWDRIESIRVSDAGHGYDHNFLKLLFSTKASGSDKIGQFGEGMKLLSTASLRNGIKVKFESRDWVAQPFSTEQTLDGKGIGVLCYRVLSGIGREAGSATTIGTVDKEIADVFRKLDDYVLCLRDGLKLEWTCASGSLFCEDKGRSIPNGSIFNKGVFITDEYSNKSLFSYDLRTDDISPDRDQIASAALQSAVRGIVSTCTNRTVIAEIINAAEKRRDEPLIEFVDVQMPCEVAGVWKDVFYSMHGKSAVIQTDMGSGLEAVHMGFKPVELNKSIERMLRRAGVEYDREVINDRFDAHYVPLENLLPAEKGMLAKLGEVDTLLGLQAFEKIRVYDELHTFAGRNMTGTVAGFWDGEYVNISRDRLSSLFTAVKTYVHERGHKETGASDPSDRFREFFESFLTSFVHNSITQPQPPLPVSANVEKQMPISFAFNGFTVRVRPANCALDATMLHIMEEAVLGKRTVIERLGGFLSGKQSWVEEQVAVEIIRPNEKPELLGDRAKLLLLRKIARNSAKNMANAPAAQVINAKKKLF